MLLDCLFLILILYYIVCSTVVPLWLDSNVTSGMETALMSQTNTNTASSEEMSLLHKGRRIPGLSCSEFPPSCPGCGPPRGIAGLAGGPKIVPSAGTLAQFMTPHTHSADVTVPPPLSPGGERKPVHFPTQDWGNTNSSTPSCCACSHLKSSTSILTSSIAFKKISPKQANKKIHQ